MFLHLCLEMNMKNNILIYKVPQKFFVKLLGYFVYYLFRDTIKCQKNGMVVTLFAVMHTH